jgi:hypothetical protein
VIARALCKAGIHRKRQVRIPIAALQLVLFYEFWRMKCNLALISDVLTRVCDIETSHGRKIRLTTENKPKLLYRSPGLDEDQTVTVLTYIRNGNLTLDYATRGDLGNYTEANYPKCLTDQRMASFLRRDAG